jgi:hypothetical protein
MLLEAFIPESEARFIPIEYFDLIALFVAEDEQCIANGFRFISCSTTTIKPFIDLRKSTISMYR